MNTYVVTEGEADAALLRRILKAVGLKRVHVEAAGGKSAAISLAKSVLISKSAPVALVVDADTVDPASVREQERVHSDLLRSASRSVPFRVFPAVPEIEAVFFHDPKTLNRLAGVNVPRSLLEEARFKPKDVLTRLLGAGPKGIGEAWLAEHLDNDAALGIAKHPLIRSLIDFIEHPADELRHSSLIGESLR